MTSYIIPGVGPYEGHLPKHYRDAIKIKQWDQEVNFPVLPGWNPQLPLKEHQKKGALWAYFAKKCLVADQTGCGKTNIALGIVMLLKARGENCKTLLLTPKAVQHQWLEEVKRFTNLNAVEVKGSKAQRVATYGLRSWDVLLVTYPQLIRDLEGYLDRLHFDLIIFDEGSAIRHHATTTAKNAKILTAKADRVVIMDATPIQMALTDLHSEVEALNVDPPVFQGLPGFNMRYINRERVPVWKNGKWVEEEQIVSYKNMDEFKTRFYPYVIRRLVSEIEDMPSLVTEPIWLELPPEQQRHYDNAKRGVKELMDAGGDIMQLRASLHTLQQACDSTYAFGDNPPVSVKMDRILHLLAGDLYNEKLVIYARYKIVVEYIMMMLRNRGYEAVRFTGDDKDDARERAKKAFNGDHTQILVGTDAIVVGLNLQCSSFMACFNRCYNPTREVQLAGRIARIGSVRSTVTKINLMCSNTMEQPMDSIINQRAAVPDFIFDEKSDHLFGQLTREEIAMLIQR